MKNIAFCSRFLYLLFFIFIVSIACNKSSEFGADLISDDAFNVTSLRDFKLSAYSVKTDSIVTFETISALADSIFLFGNTVDPVFGRVQSTLAFNMRIRRIIEQWDPANTVDSMVYDIAVDPANFFGDTLKPLNLYLHQLKAQLSTTDSVFYSNRNLEYEPEVIGFLENYLFTPRTTIEVIDTTKDPPDTSRVRKFLRFRMDDFARKLFAQPEVFSSSANFFERFRGMVLRAEGEGPLVGLILSNPNGIAKIYYSRNGESQTPIEIEVNPGNVRMAQFKHETEGFPIQPFLTNQSMGDSLCFVQGMSGARTVVEVGDLDRLKGKSIKLAQLEFFVATGADNENEQFRVPPQLLFFGINEAGETTDVREVILLSTPNLIANLGGRVIDDVVNGERVRKYTINLTTHFLRMVTGQETNRILIAPFGASKRANRVTIYGPGHSRYPMQLKLIVTDIN
jgi:hypothetical protein